MSVCTSAAKPASSSVPPRQYPPDAELPASSGTGRGTGDQVDTRGYHCCGVDQRGAGVGPAIASASHVCNGNCADYRPHRPAASASPTSACYCRHKVRWCQFHHFAEVQGAQFVERMNSAKARNTSPTRVTTNASLPLRHSSDRCNRNRSADRRQAHAFPAEVHQQ